MEEEKKTNKSGDKRGTKDTNKQNFANNKEAASKAGKKGGAKKSVTAAITQAQGLTAGRNRRITPETQQYIREEMFLPDASGTPYIHQFIHNFLDTAKKDANSQAARILANTVFKEDMLATLDAEVNKQLAKDAEFTIYRIRQTLYDKQKEVFDDNLSRTIECICTRRAGKCWGKGTKLRLYNGAIKNVEDIEIGDILIDEKSRPTEVIGLARGKDTMYKVSANVENAKLSFICNSAHILTVMRTSCKWREYETDKIYDIPLQEFILFPKDEQAHFSLYRARTEYASNPHTIDPYIIGLWLGDGNKNDAQICVNKDDEDIRDFLEDNYRVSIYEDKRSKALSYNLLGYKDKFRKLNLLGNKHIPISYKIDSIDNRLKLLAGLIDSDGYRSNNRNSIEISSSNKALADDIFELCCSLGFRVLIREKQAKLYGVPKALNYTITIKGNLDDIPNVLKRKHANNSKQRPVYGFNITELHKDEYFGFTLNGNGRCLLADYTVTHNTELVARLLVAEALKPPYETPVGKPLERNAIYLNRSFDNAIGQMGKPVTTLLDSLDIKYSGSPGSGKITLDNGSSIWFGGYNNKGDIDKYRGFHFSLIALDEVSHLRNPAILMKETLEPALKDYGYEGRTIMTGTPPRNKVNYAYQMWHNPNIKHYHWSFMDNPYIPNKEEIVAGVCKEHGVDETAPFVQREYFGNMEAFDTDAMIFRGYKTIDRLPENTFDYAWVGVDWGYEDKAAVVSVIAKNKKAYIIRSWAESKKSISEICEVIKEHLNNLKSLNIARAPWVICDQNEKSAVYELYQTYKISNVYCAYKYDKDMAMEQLSEWCRNDTIFVVNNNNDAIISDMENALWKRDEETDVITHEIADDEYHMNAGFALLYASRQFDYECFGVTQPKSAKSILEGRDK